MALISLSKIRPGQQGKIKKITGKGLFFTRLRALGLRADAEIALIRKAPFGGPLHIRIGAQNNIALPQQEAAHILLAV